MKDGFFIKNLAVFELNSLYIWNTKFTKEMQINITKNNRTARLDDELGDSYISSSSWIKVCGSLF